MKFTTSWDDGVLLDRKLADILNRRGMTGTFYVCPTQKKKERRLLSEGDIRALATEHEIGAHSKTHPHLSQISTFTARREIEGSKTWVEDITRKPCTMFCYPYGDWNEEVKKIVKEAGFTGARTVEELQFCHRDPFLLPTSLQILPFPRRRGFEKIWHWADPLGPLRSRYRRLRKLHVPLRSCTSWLKLATYLFHHALTTKQPFFHLWGHSWEIEKYDMWDDLEWFLKMVGEAGEKVKHVTNSALLKK